LVAKEKGRGREREREREREGDEMEREGDLFANAETKSSYEKYEYSVPQRNVSFRETVTLKAKLTTTREITRADKCAPG